MFSRKADILTDGRHNKSERSHSLIIVPRLIELIILYLPFTRLAGHKNNYNDNDHIILTTFQIKKNQQQLQ